MIKTISRAPNDNFTFSLFTDLVDSLVCEYEAYYIWSNPHWDLKKFLVDTQFSKPNVIIGIKDLLDCWEEYNFWQDTAQSGVRLLDHIANNYPDTNFIIFTSLENINLEKTTSSNIHFIPWGGDITNQANLYQHVAPVTNKNFDSNKTYISLNRHNRAHRLVLLSYLFGKEYDQYGIITYLGQQIDTRHFDNLLDCIAWEFEPRHDVSRTAMLQGYPQFYNNQDLAVDHYQIYESTNDNVTNFNQSLRAKYQNSFAELVTESSFSAPSFMITEKFLNSVYGCNFPILLSGAGAVAHLRDIGFDMFDDIVNHNYDLITNPFDRIISAVEDNKKLLLDAENCKKLWMENKDRFDYNINIAKNHMYSWFKNRATVEFDIIKWRSRSQ